MVLYLLCFGEILVKCEKEPRFKRLGRLLFDFQSPQTNTEQIGRGVEMHSFCGTSSADLHGMIFAQLVILGGYVQCEASTDEKG